MAGIQLEWAQFGDFDSFDVLRSDSPMDIDALPSPIVTGLPTMFYADTTVVEGATYYYRVVAWRDGVSKVSSEIKAIADRDEYWDKVVALLHFDNNLEDAAGAVWNKFGSVSIGSDQQLFGSDSAYFNEGYLYRDTDDFAFGLDDFTVESFVYLRPDSPKYGSLFSFGGQDYLTFKWTFDAEESVYVYSGALGDMLAYAYQTSLLKKSQWLHLAFTRENGVWRIFIGGIKAAENVRVFNVAGSRTAYIGYGHPASYDRLRASVREFRITKGIARYTTNFTPPDAPFLSS